jgi:hypothetical protein
MNAATNKFLADRFLGNVTWEDYVTWAVGCLESGLDSKNIRILASLETPFYSSEVKEYFDRSLQDLGWKQPGRLECLIEYARSIAEHIVNGTLHRP